jgi:hypothetical protein
VTPKKSETEDDIARERLFARICLARGETPTGPMAIYRRLVRSGLASTVFKLLPRTRARMNRDHDDAFDKAFVAFLDDSGPRTHFMRDVPGELVRWAENFWRESKIDARWIELARYEAARFAVDSAPDDDADVALAEIDLARGVVFSRAMHVAHFEHAVHELPENPDDFASPQKRAVSVLIYRDRDNDVVDLELTPFFAKLIETSRDGVALKDALTEAARKEGVVLNDELLASVARFLADLGERGVLLGGAAK